MASFRDKRGKRWEVRLCGPSIMAARFECNVDLVGCESIQPIAVDTQLLTDVLCVLCGSYELETTLAGDAFTEATDALYAAISEFYPDPNEINEQGSASESSDEEFDPAKKCFEIAGILGIQPDGRTFRELIWMIQGKNEHLASQFGESEEAAMPYNPAVLQGLSN